MRPKNSVFNNDSDDEAAGNFSLIVQHIYYYFVIVCFSVCKLGQAIQKQKLPLLTSNCCCFFENTFDRFKNVFFLRKRDTNSSSILSGKSKLTALGTTSSTSKPLQSAMKQKSSNSVLPHLPEGAARAPTKIQPAIKPVIKHPQRSTSSSGSGKDSSPNKYGKK